MRRFALPILILVAVLVALSCFFVVQEGRTALVIRLGKIHGDPVGPGLHFKLPLLDDVREFDARVLAWDGDPERIPVKDSKFIYVDSFARWRITNAERFYNAVRDEQGAQSRLDDILNGSIRDVVSEHFLLELVRTTDEPLESARIGFGEGVPVADEAEEAPPVEEQVQADLPVSSEAEAEGQRLEVRREIFEICERKLEELDLGIALVDLRIKRIDYTEQVEKEVYRRMVSQQERLAERYRAQGEGKRAEIAGGTRQERQRIESESYRRAQEIKGEGEAESTRIYAEAYGADENLYRFVKSLETYEQILDSDDTLILSTDSEVLRYLKRQQ
ncbi:MAG: protease modulator HflC [Thermoanaerobaculia bacterium]|nr:protease modulator HflC [Thermoanaerobaculia bacterium]